MTACASPLSFERLVDYTAGDLAPGDEEHVEAHYFACRRCAQRLAVVEALGAGVIALVRHGAARASVTHAVTDRIAREGLVVRHYVLAPGDVVPCTASPDDDFVLVELTGPGAAAASVEVNTEILSSGASTRHTLLTSLDPGSGSILMLFPAEAVRAYPRSRWTMSVSLEGELAEPPVSYVLDHTPWRELVDGGPPRA